MSPNAKSAVRSTQLSAVFVPKLESSVASNLYATSEGLSTLYIMSESLPMPTTIIRVIKF